MTQPPDVGTVTLEGAAEMGICRTPEWGEPAQSFLSSSPAVEVSTLGEVVATDGEKWVDVSFDYPAKDGLSLAEPETGAVNALPAVDGQDDTATLNSADTEDEYLSAHTTTPMQSTPPPAPPPPPLPPPALRPGPADVPADESSDAKSSMKTKDQSKARHPDIRTVQAPPSSGPSDLLAAIQQKTTTLRTVRIGELGASHDCVLMPNTS
ncbi:hypothetical protein CYMTET_25919 [Cymbomonas tetramitiformis]|uniref:WH2 domain-containing protein n=1 Tax=Cymbomonas tetramitiformis TaxID=36881 RepID=A0AAE0FTK5_9CHLO|nr:hypothetical protein CYMTET_25919 [Cymbomonas tetramitiformis]